MQYYSLNNEVENQSDHNPIVLALQINIVKQLPREIINKKRKKWKEANDNHITMYKRNLDEYLMSLTLPTNCMHCNYMLCDDDDHIQDIMHMHDDLISACITASSVIPDTKQKTHQIPGWDASISNDREIALFWRSIWQNMNSPRSGIVSDIVRRTRANYHYAIRRLKKQSDQLSKNAMAQSIANNNYRDLWKETSKIRNSKSTTSTCIDNKINDDDITKVFFDKYNILYNSVRYNDNSLNMLLADNLSEVKQHCMDCSDDDYVYSHKHVITIENVQEAIHKLKSGKSDCVDSMMSDNLLHGTNRLFQYIACLFTTMLCHGIAPTGFLLSKLVPIPKNKRGNKCDSNNYRQIAISSLLCKVFDIIILDSKSKSLGTDVFRDRKICPIVLRLLMNMYINQTIQVRWNNTLSDVCGISNGVKQGGCLSPTLFSLYINDLINILQQNNIGCRYGPHYMGVYGYADDISLLCPTVSGMKEMLKTCETFAKQHDILFNASKSQLLWFGNGKKTIHISLKMENGLVIPYVDSCKHLGNEISMNRMNVFINNATNDLHCRLNSLLADFSHCDSVTLSILFKTYCMNLYGSQMWRYNDKTTRSFYTCWRKAIRRLYNIPYRTHNILVHHIINSYPIDVVLEKRCIKYRPIWNLINSGCKLHADIVFLSMDNMYSTIGENMRYFMYKYKFSTNDWYRPLSFLNNKIDTYVNSTVNFDIVCTAKF